MPELPDVEVYRRYVNATSLHQRVRHVHVHGPALLLGTSPQGLGRALSHKTFRSTSRHGKYLFVNADTDEWLVMHFGMTGDVACFSNKTQEPDYTQLLITFASGYHLAYISRRKLGLIALTESPDKWAAERKLGPDALALSEAEFIQEALGQRSGAKAWLMNQQRIAGLGNVYSDEILFQAGIHPRYPLSALGEPACKRLFRAMRSVLQEAIRAGADPDRMPPTFLLPRRRKGGRCPACDAPLATLKAAGRTSWYCPRCQPS